MSEERPAASEITELICSAHDGDLAARDRLFDRLHADLQRLARSRIAQSGPLTLIDAPSLVQEAYLRLSVSGLPASNRGAFLAYAAQAMRNVVIDYVRSRNAEKRGGDRVQVTLSGQSDAASGGPATVGGTADFEALESAMKSLAEIDERCHKVVELRYFAGLSIEQAAEVLELSPATVKREWQKARAFLYHALSP